MDQDIFAHIFEKTISCTQCNLCILGCPMFMGTRRDFYSPRALIILLREDSQKHVFTEHTLDLIFTCNLCSNCNVRCPAKIDIVGLVKLVRESLLKLSPK